MQHVPKDGKLLQPQARDLLSKTHTAKLNLRDNPESGVFAEGLSAFAVKSAEELAKLLATGQRNRKVGATLMNAVSSRSHSIFTLAVESADKEGRVRMGKLNLVDLAGSERQSKAGSVGERFREAMKINLSLSALGNVISALAEQSPFIPYRDSKLTRILQASLGGNTRTAMVANVGPACVHYDETLSTLRYAQRTKHIKNAPHVNEDPKQAVILAFQEEIARLKQQLQAAEGASPKTSQCIALFSKSQAANVSSLNTCNQDSFSGYEKAIEMARRKAEEDLKAKEVEVAMYEQHKAELAIRLQNMEAQLLRGNAEVSKAKQQQRELKRTQLRLEEQKKMEEQLRRERDQGTEARLLLESLVTSKDKELSHLSSKVQELCRRYTEVVDDIEDLQKEFQAERESLLHDIRSMELEMRLQQAIIDRFIPPEEATRIRTVASWDEVQGEWIIPNSELTGNGMDLCSMLYPTMLQLGSFMELPLAHFQRNDGLKGEAAVAAMELPCGMLGVNRMRADSVAETPFSVARESCPISGRSHSDSRAADAVEKALEYVKKRYFKEYPCLPQSPDVEVVGQQAGAAFHSRMLPSSRHASAVGSRAVLAHQPGESPL
ncbi:kinesin motor domain-containing protein, putative [Eimeria mitis]|uniref:Kinesin-like protein n=1 Tax=Eimeria mitis TaxID=44415 RepID=U6KF35_9EIME|nr:kinesin motor domain-containing protein, putative [Eimeria mitis]CDJ36564.1 kinesin motor domain-containing protein, putative [Eimeria mitis]